MFLFQTSVWKCDHTDQSSKICVEGLTVKWQVLGVWWEVVWGETKVVALFLLLFPFSQIKHCN